MKPVLRLEQAAWLAEIGVDMHWLETQPMAAAPAAAVSLPTVESAPPASETRPVASAAPVGPVSVKSLLGRLQPPGGAGVRALPTATPPVSEGDRVVLADLDLPALAAAIQACRQCPRHEQRLRAVPGAGQADRPFYLIVAEQPGIEDEVAGLPFQGDAGRLLDAMLAAVRLPQAASRYGTYAVKCRALGGQQPDVGEIAACIPYLQHEIAVLRPHWILALGRVAAQAVLGATVDFDAVRGAAQTHRAADGVETPVWVTHQPASMLVRGALKSQAWRDLAGLAQAVQASQIVD
ncbi:uracil-DNA glycosylase [Castellaniella sp.]|uniref:uracil-DNA glycosylase n=1 Tax=Castellaniella sp. TaxID=1955812 RepID=UPI002AFFC9FD|nr:uracil-DNA glycosylase [Castellaniella sp.]